MSAYDFVHLYPKGMNPCTLEKSAYSRAVETWLCTSCCAPKPTAGLIDVQIQEERPGDNPITFVSGCGVVLARSELLTALGPKRVHDDLLLGIVRGPSGQVMREWVTVRGRHRVIVRGSRNVSYRQCELCGRHVYFAMGARYLFPAPLGGASIYESDLYGLVVAPSVLEGASLDQWINLGIEKLKVLHKPKDLLGELL